MGSLIYLTLTRPDIFYAVGVVSRFMQNPRQPHLDAVLRILRYIAKTIDFGILYSNTYVQFPGFTYADYAGDVDTRRSTSGFIFSLGSGVASDNQLLFCHLWKQNIKLLPWFYRNLLG
ncbi:hypothetical protein COCNU_10G004280 [Cocos nucifera]|uniref:Mitochondrial protein n=1 Tax=Cocos nucifera TaxID=13894 RepID=A0A8K0IM55_COCNU|nr:hypothetical protein COCNU_10G004280 [Cocos nucifera]